MIQETLRTYLSDYAGLKALIGTRFYAVQAPHKTDAPYCVYRTISNPPEYTHSGKDGSHARFQVSCFAETYKAALQVAEQVINALHAWPHSDEVKSVFVNDTQDLYDDTTKMYHVPVDFTIRSGS
jgi:hypothetical protein